jgi:hypothetical protein
MMYAVRGTQKYAAMEQQMRDQIMERIQERGVGGTE